MLMLKYVPVIALALQRVLSTPWGTLNGRSNTSSAADGLVKRVAPRMGPNGGGFTQAEQVQIAGGWKDACELANVAYARAKLGDKIFNKYFPDSVAHNVRGVFGNIIGGRPLVCADELYNLIFRADFRDANGDMSCNDPENMGETRNQNSHEPTIILCKSGLL